MADDEKTEGPKFSVTVEDCQRWMDRLRRMAQVMEKKSTHDGQDGAKMFYTASVMMLQLSMQIQQDALLAGVSTSLFGHKDIGEA